jgi:hypothetical protein
MQPHHAMTLLGLPAFPGISLKTGLQACWLSQDLPAKLALQKLRKAKQKILHFYNTIPL